MRQSKQEVEEAKEQLRKFLKPGDTVYTVLRHVSRSGMQREISLHVVKDGEVQWITGYASTILGMRIGKRDGLIAGGAGMDMGFHLVMNLGYALFPDGFGCVGNRQTTYVQHTVEDCPAKKYHPEHPECDHKSSYTSKDACPSNDHSNGDRDYTPSLHDSLAASDVANGRKHEHSDFCHWHKSGGYALRHRWI